MKPVTNLSHTTAVVTGGGRGLGRAFAQALAAAGANVAVIARSAGELDQTVSSIGAYARAFSADVTDAETIGAAFRQIGPVDLLVNNAGVIGPIGPFAETDFSQWWRAIDVNLRGAMLCTNAVLPEMIERRRGRIINVVTGAFSAAYLSAYLAGKTALVRATECLAAETRPYGLALFSIAPGTVRTEMAEHSLTSPEGRRWIPWFQRIFDEGLDLPAERPAALVVALASGKYDALSGLYLTPFDDLDAILADRSQVEKDRLHGLQIWTHKSSVVPGSIAAIRDAAIRAKL
ncbi:MAG TPA: SDR family NAD(P)-dependent oxidoreductase [Bryobacteraceae bacterium]|nr:SDR family NAD(P)-dependent oxidoreductase [Bryobacteraceae bacterium]